MVCEETAGGEHVFQGGRSPKKRAGLDEQCPGTGARRADCCRCSCRTPPMTMTSYDWARLMLQLLRRVRRFGQRQALSHVCPLALIVFPAFNCVVNPHGVRLDRARRAAPPTRSGE